MSLRSSQYIAIAAAVALIGVLYFWGNTTPPDKLPENTRPQGETAIPPAQDLAPFSIDSFIDACRKTLDATKGHEIDALQQDLKNAGNDAERMALNYKLAHAWEINNYKPIAAYFGAFGAKLENSEKKLNFAGQFFLELMYDSSNTGSMRVWEANQAIACFKRALELNGDDDSTKVNLALAYIEGTNETMQGVQLLLALTREKPDHLAANLVLGKMAVRSAQWDKAIKRLEHLLEKYPENTEALYFLAEAYKGSGNKEKAIALFEQCKRIVNKPGFSKEIDEYINSFK
jgi:tetratricopeptide (TPR) repeat protein